MKTKGGGKMKGGAFERKVCSDLSLWLSHGKRKDLLWRSAMSGGRATVANKKGVQLQTQVGDISAIHPLGSALIERFVVECKFYRDLNILGMLSGAKTGLNKFWTDAINTAIKHNKHAILIAKQNRMPPLVLIDDGMFSLGLVRKDIVVEFPNIPCGCYMMWYDQFLKAANPPVQRVPRISKPKLRRK